MKPENQNMAASEQANEQLKHQMLEEYSALSVVHGPDETI